MTVEPTSGRNHNGGVSLRDHFESCLNAAERLQSEKWLGHEKAHELIALALKTQAVASEERLKNMNEWRGTVGDLSARYVTREALEGELKAIKAEVRQNLIVAVAITAVFSGLIGLVLRAIGI